MKKDIEWLKDKIRAERERLALSLSEGQETMREFILNNGKHGALVDVLELIDQLDEPEVLSTEEGPLYYAWVKGDDELKCWDCTECNLGHLFIGPKEPKFSCTDRMTKKNWNKLGINDSNADFVKVGEQEADICNK